MPFLVEFGAPAAPDVNAQEKEQPHHINEVPIPSGGFEAEMLAWAEVAFVCSSGADDQEYRSDNDVKAVETRRHE